MDDKGRLHMPNGFIGKTFEETGLEKKKILKEQVGVKVEEGNNRHARRKAKARLRKLEEK